MKSFNFQSNWIVPAAERVVAVVPAKTRAKVHFGSSD